MGGKRQIGVVACAVLVFGVYCGVASADLYSWAAQIDSVSFDSLDPDPNPVPAGVDVSGFDASSGIGTITIAITGAGNHFVGVFVDHEFAVDDNTFFNETGMAVGAAGAGQSWEIDEPGWFFGDIYANLRAGALDNTNALDGIQDDVSMALAWDFSLTAQQSAFIEFVVGPQPPLSGFYLTHLDPDSDDAVYFSSTLNIVPLPGAVFLGMLGLGAAGWRLGRKR